MRNTKCGVCACVELRVSHAECVRPESPELDCLTHFGQVFFDLRAESQRYKAHVFVSGIQRTSIEHCLVCKRNNAECFIG